MGAELMGPQTPVCCTSPSTRRSMARFFPSAVVFLFFLEGGIRNEIRQFGRRKSRQTARILPDHCRSELATTHTPPPPHPLPAGPALA